MLLFTSCVASVNNSLFGWGYQYGYYENLPRQRTKRGQKDSACSNGQYSNNYGFGCPHMMMFSADMLLSSKYDKNDKNFFYAVAGSSTDNDCGKCYQVKVSQPQHYPKYNYKQLIVQIINSGGDVAPGQFDLFMGAGGFGIYTACNSDCAMQYCNGGGCKTNLYAGNFKQWTGVPYYDRNLCYAGGLNKLNSTTISMCRSLTNNQTTLKDRILIDSCYLSNKNLYHQNFYKADSTRVQCPKGLYMLTGLRRADDNIYPIAHIENPLTIHCSNKACITTMCDCCKPSCAWWDKGNPTREWFAVDTCNSDGYIYDYF